MARNSLSGTFRFFFLNHENCALLFANNWFLLLSSSLKKNYLPRIPGFFVMKDTGKIQGYFYLVVDGFG